MFYVLYPFDWPPCRDPARQVSASPASINVLPEYGSDPRTADKLLDGERMLSAERAGTVLRAEAPGLQATCSIAPQFCTLSP